MIDVWRVGGVWREKKKEEEEEKGATDRIVRWVSGY